MTGFGGFSAGALSGRASKNSPPSYCRVYLGVLGGLAAFLLRLEPLAQNMALAAGPPKPQRTATDRSPLAFATSVPDNPDPPSGL
jgi:hypothetical protein